MNRQRKYKKISGKVITLILSGIVLAGVLVGIIINNGSEKSSDEKNREVSETIKEKDDIMDNVDSEDDITESDWDYIKNKGFLTIGVTNYRPMSYLDDDGNWTGLDVEFAKAVCEELDIGIRFVEINRNESKDELYAKNVDCIWNGMEVTDERKDIFEFTKAYMTDEPVIFAKTEIKNISDIDGKKIVFVEGSVSEKIVAERFAENESVPVVSTVMALEAVDSGESDIAIVDSVSVYSLTEVKEGIFKSLKSTHMNYDKGFYAVAFRKDSDACEKVNEAILALKENGKLDRIATKYGLTNCLVK